MSAPMVKAQQNGHTYGVDLDAKRAARQAAAHDGLYYRFRFGGREFTLKPNTDMPANAKAMLAEGDIVDLMGEILVEDSALFWAVRPRPTMADVTDLIEAWSDWSGTGDLPNSPGSPPPLSTPT